MPVNHALFRTTTSPIPFPIWPDTSLKDRSSSIDSSTTSRSILPSTSSPPSPVSWRKLSKRIEKITPPLAISSTLTMPLLRILLPWRLSLVRRYFFFYLGPDWRGSDSFGVPQEIRAWIHCSRSVRIQRSLRLSQLGLETVVTVSQGQPYQDSWQNQGQVPQKTSWRGWVILWIKSYPIVVINMNNSDWWLKNH